MQCELIPAVEEHKVVINNLMQFYIYDFSRMINYDVENNGVFMPYPALDEYWPNGSERFPYIIKVQGKYAGFILVKFIHSENKSYFSIAEFFIMNKYRRMGIGKKLAWQIFDLHKGTWEVFQIEQNKAAQQFWRNIISEYTKGNLTEYVASGKTFQQFSN